MTNCSDGLYVSPSMGTTVNSLETLNITWDPSCLSCSSIDIYLYAPSSPLPRLHIWESVALSRGYYPAQLMPRWWNDSTIEVLQIIIVPSGDPPFMSTFPAGPVFNATYSPNPSSSANPAANTNIIDSGVTRVDDLQNQQATKKAISGHTAVAVLFTLIFLALIIVGYIKWKRRKEHQKRKAWTEKIDKRMSTISTDWKSVSAAGAQAAIRNSIAVATRNSAFSFGAIRPNSSAHDNDDDLPLRSSSLRTGTGVGLRDPNALSASRSSTTSTRVSRVSFAPDPPRFSRADSSDTASTFSRKNVPSRAFHSAYIPPVPALPDSLSSDKRTSLSPRQTAGPLALTPEDIKARITSSKPSLAAIDEFMPALSMMRNNVESDDFLLSTPEPAYSPSTPTLSITSAFPTPPSTNSTPIVLSPDEMLRAYAERKKSLADAARAGRIGAPLTMRVSGVPSVVAPTVASSSLASLAGVETVSSIHATGMRVAYNQNEDDGMVLPPPPPAVFLPPQGQVQQQQQRKVTRALSFSSKKGIEGGKALIGKAMKGIGKTKGLRKSVNPFVRSEPEPEPEHDVVVENPGEAYVAALEAEAEQGDVADDVVGAYPYPYLEQAAPSQVVDYYTAAANMVGYEPEAGAEVEVDADARYYYDYQYGAEGQAAGEAHQNHGERGGAQAFGY